MIGDIEAWKKVSSRAPVWGASSAARGNEILIGSFKSCPRVGGIKGRLPMQKMP